MSEGQRRSALVVEARELTKVFAAPSSVQAVRGVSLTIESGEFVALIGPSGAGKTTLLGALGGLQSPSEGSVSVNGRDLYSLDRTGIARVRNIDIGFVFQFHHLLPELTAEENVALPGLVACREGWSDTGPQSVYSRARELLAAVGLAERTRHLPVQLSGGEAQRVSLARALVNRPSLVLADEPTGNLDQETSRDLMDLMEKMNRGSRQTFLIATHNAELVSRASRVLRIVNGEMRA